MDLLTRSASGLRGETKRVALRSRRLGLALMLVLAFTLAGCAGTALPTEPSAPGATVAEVHLSPTCTCCTEYVAYLRRAGWTVEVVEEPDIAAFQAARGVPDAARGCHTILVDGDLVEGHVPLPAIERLLAERPAIDASACRACRSARPA